MSGRTPRHASPAHWPARRALALTCDAPGGACLGAWGTPHDPRGGAPQQAALGRAPKSWRAGGWPPPSPGRWDWVRDAAAAGQQQWRARRRCGASCRRQRMGGHKDVSAAGAAGGLTV